MDFHGAICRKNWASGQAMIGNSGAEHWHFSESRSHEMRVGVEHALYALCSIAVHQQAEERPTCRWLYKNAKSFLGFVDTRGIRI